MNENEEIADKAAENEIQSDAFAAQRNLAQRMSNPKLSALRAQNPFLSIVPFPNSVLTVLLDTAGVAQDVDLPQGTKFISIASSGAYFVSRNGNAQLPTNKPEVTGSTFFDKLQFIYVEEVRQLSFVTVAAGNSICINCFQQL